MTELVDRKIDEYGQVYFTETGLCNALMQGHDISDYVVEMTENVQRFQELQKTFSNCEAQLTVYEKPTVSLAEYDAELQKNWFMPEHYRTFDLETFLYNKCTTEAQANRVQQELHLYAKYNMMDVLRFLVHFVDSVRQRGLFTGCGRGSSVASYVLFLIGLHRVDSLKYNLDIHEFLKE